MNVLYLVLGMVSALAGAVFIVIALVFFLNGTVRSAFSPELWIWIGFHSASALLSLVFFRLAAGASGKGGGAPGEGDGPGEAV